MRVHLVRAGYSGCDDKEMEDEMSEEKYLCPQCGTMNNELRAEIARRDERIAELEAMVNPASFKKFLIGQIKDPELAKEYAKACIQDDTYKELLARRDEIITRLKNDLTASVESESTKKVKLYDLALEYAAAWIENSLVGEENARVIEFGKNMAMSIRAAKEMKDDKEQ